MKWLLCGLKIRSVTLTWEQRTSQRSSTMLHDLKIDIPRIFCGPSGPRHIMQAWFPWLKGQWFTKRTRINPLQLASLQLQNDHAWNPSRALLSRVPRCTQNYCRNSNPAKRGNSAGKGKRHCAQESRVEDARHVLENKAKCLAQFHAYAGELFSCTPANFLMQIESKQSLWLVIVGTGICGCQKPHSHSDSDLFCKVFLSLAASEKL